MSDKIESLNVLVLEPSPTNPRRKFDAEALNELAASIQALGVMVPLVVRLLQPGRYEIVAGERRFRAAKLAGHKFLPCLVRPLSDAAVLECQLVENLQRADLDPVEEARGFRALLDLKLEDGRPAATVESISERVGKSVRYVHARLKLLDLPDVAVKALEDKAIAVGTAEMIARVPDRRLREKVAGEIISPKGESEPMTIEASRALIERSYMRSLSGADFDPEDGSLHPKGVKCSGCEHRAGNTDASAGGDGRRSGTRGDMCLNPVCFDKKARVSFDRWKGLQEAEGRKVLSPEDNRKLVQGDHIVAWASNMVVLDESPGAHLLNASAAGERVPSWRVLVEGQAVDVCVARLASGKALECVDREAATAAAKLNGHSIFKLTNREEREALADEQRRRKEERAGRLEALRGTLSDVATAAAVAPMALDEWLLRMIGVVLDAGLGHVDLVAEAMGVEDVKHLRALMRATGDGKPGGGNPAWLQRLAAVLALSANVDDEFELNGEARRIVKRLGLKKRKVDNSAMVERERKRAEDLLAAARALRAEDPARFSVHVVLRKFKLGYQAACKLFDEVVESPGEDGTKGTEGTEGTAAGAVKEVRP